MSHIDATRPKPVLSHTIRPGGRVYYFDLYPPRNGGQHCLTICELRKDGSGKNCKVRIFLYPEAVKETIRVLGEVDGFLSAKE